MSTPFLKWAGGKRWLATSGAMPIPASFDRLVEPFVGGGAVFFHLEPKSALLGDANADLIQLYRVMRDSPDRLWSAMNKHQTRHSRDYYYRMRESRPRTAIGQAARFLYLNRTCWNGLYRVNLAGKFNVPKGTKDTVVFRDEDFKSISDILLNADLISGDFEKTIDRSGRGDFLFVDPPYTVQHNLNGFIKYNEHLFSWNDQIRLRDSLKRAVQRGAEVILTNADHESVRALYEEVLEYRPIVRATVLAGNSNFRGRTTEALFVSPSLRSRAQSPTAGEQQLLI